MASRSSVGNNPPPPFGDDALDAVTTRDRNRVVALRGAASTEVSEFHPAQEEPRPVSVTPAAARRVGATEDLFDVEAAFPERAKSSFVGVALFVLMVVVPTAAAAYYYYAVASNQYVSEFRFAVTESTPATVSSPMTASSGGQGLSSALGSLGIASMATAQNYIVTDYLSSRQLVEDLEARIRISDMFSRPGVDWLSRFDNSKSTEDLTAYWSKMMTARFDPVTGLATAEVHAFTPADAQLIATNLVSLSEEIVNRIAMRAKEDSVRFAEAEVKGAETRLKAARAALTEFRSTEGVIDPTTSVVSGNVQDVATMRAALIQLQTELSILERQKVDPSSPVATALRNKVSGTQEQLERLEKEVGGDRGNNAAITSVVARYEQLDLERQYAQNMLLSTMQSLDQARAAAGSQQLYLTPYVRPALPDKSTYPNRLTSVLTIMAAAFGIWLLTNVVLRTVRG